MVHLKASDIKYVLKILSKSVTCEFSIFNLNNLKCGFRLSLSGTDSLQNCKNYYITNNLSLVFPMEKTDFLFKTSPSVRVI